ncbi:YhdP family protein [Candidatus Contendibacter odensensis]|uniref:YhdP central domain-containing protein n=1 Tax=Candidatus Contendobacter odensis Run_B_J11 TaxID=1400861 RepID=A0A7U7GAI4_9GAMM|nr:YhdP family protein [Candidatus Contendobacter odensis]CDH44885.1 exported hypothetical protein [Candidatus Contendobacter odensis Run_B_J11]
MRRVWGAARQPLRWARRLVLALLLPLLLLAAFGQWWLLPRLNDYREALATALGDYLHVPAQIKAVTAEREGWWLGLRLQGVSLRDPETGAVLASFSRAAATVNLWRSVWEWRPAFSHIRLEGVNLTLEQGPEETLRLRADASAAESAPSLPEVARWLFEVGRLDLIGDQLTLRRRDGVALHLLHPYFQVRDTPHGQRLLFTAELPGDIGDRIEFSVERPHADPEFWQGTFEFRADRLHLADWKLPLGFTAGQAALELRGDWRDWRPTRIEGRLRLSGAELDAPSRFALLGRWLTNQPATELTLDGQKLETGWQLRGHAQFEDRKGQIVAEPTFELSQTGEQWQGRVRDLRAQDVAAWATRWLNEPTRPWLASLNPQGDLPEIAVQAATGTYAVTAQLRDVALQAAHGLPGLSHLTGTLEFAPDQCRVKLDSRQVRVDTAGLLRAPITLDTLAGTLTWAREADGLRLESTGLDLANADLNARIWGRVTVPSTGQPLLDLQGFLRDVRVERVRHYLPTTLPADGLAWLDQALVDGRAAGNLMFRGSLADFPFDNGQGLFETRLWFENVTLDYAPGWPRLERLRAAATFRNRGLRVEAASGHLLDAKAERITAWIDDLDQATVRVQSQIKGPGATLWRALKDSPVGQELGEDLPDLRISGANTLDLDLTLPLPVNARTNRVKGQVGLLGGGVILPGWNLELGRLRGEVRFTEASLDAKDVQTLLRGEPIRLDLDLIDREGRRELQTRLRGRLGLPALVGEPTATALAPYVSGKSAWEAVLTVPTGRREQRDEAPRFALDLHSDLRGIVIQLPQPLGKTATEIRPLRIDLHPHPPDALELALEYGEEVRATLELAGFPRDPRLASGELRINAGAAKLPDVPGLAVVARLPRWELTAPASPLLPAPKTKTLENARPWRVLRNLDARIGELIVGRQRFSGVTLNATRQDQGMQLELDGEALAGRVILPDQPSPERPIHAALRRLYLHRLTDSIPSVAKNTRDSDPRQLPPLVFTASDLRLDKAMLGQLRLVAMPYPSGIRLSEFTLDSERQRIDASGDWRWAIGGQASRLQATLHSRALGETLTAFGYSGAGIARGETQAELVAEWAAALPDFALDRLEGTLKFQVGPGQLLDVDPGMGRMIGLFNVQNLMRRLSLDFSDLFQSGTGFDQITGEFTFRQGQAYTDNLTIEAPAAHIQIQGRTGLKERDYEQRVTVTPRFGGALPIAGVLAGGPAVGAAVLLAERLLQKGIEQATRYHYALTGSWDRPVIKLVEEPHPTAPPKGWVGDQ